MLFIFKNTSLKTQPPDSALDSTLSRKIMAKEKHRTTPYPHPHPVHKHNQPLSLLLFSSMLMGSLRFFSTVRLPRSVIDSCLLIFFIRSMVGQWLESLPSN